MAADPPDLLAYSTGLSRERQLLLALVTHWLRSPETQPEEALGDGRCDWRVLCEEAEVQGVAPLVYCVLRTRPRDCPPAVWERLAASHDRTAGRNALALLQLDRVLTALMGEGAGPVMLLKGISLAHRHYPSLALRPMADLDILVPPARQDQVATAVQALGYRPVPVLAPTLWHASLLSEVAHHVQYAPPPDEAALPLEIHSAPPSYPGVEWPGLWETAQAVAALGDGALVPSSVDEPAILLLHLVRHHRSTSLPGRLIWWLDLALVLQGAHSTTWDGLAERLATWPPKWTGAGKRILAVLGAVLGVPVPSAMAPALPLDETRREVAAIFRRPGEPTFAEIWDEVGHSPRLASPFAKLRFAGGYLFPSPAYVRQRDQVGGGLGLLGWYAARPVTLGVWLLRSAFRR